MPKLLAPLMHTAAKAVLGTIVAAVVLVMVLVVFSAAHGAEPGLTAQSHQGLQLPPELNDSAPGDRMAVQRETGDVARLSTRACTHPKIVPLIKKEDLPRFHAAVVKVGHQIFLACYAEREEDFLLVFEDGDTGSINKHMLLPDA